MSSPTTSSGEIGREAFGTACGLAVVAGGLSVVAPMFDLLTVTLVALALAGWSSAHRRGAGVRRPLAACLGTYGLPFCVLAGVTLVFFDPPGPVAPWRALLLGLGVVPLWTVERRRPARGAASEEGA